MGIRPVLEAFCTNKDVLSAGRLSQLALLPRVHILGQAMF